MTYEPLSYADLPGWADDDHSAALRAFRNSFDRLRKTYPALAEPADIPARQYFEAHFSPFLVKADADTSDGLFTGYYEPVLRGARSRSERFHVPLLRRPDDLETLLDDSLRAAAGTSLTHARRTPDGGAPRIRHASRSSKAASIRTSLELLYLEDPVAAFFLHVQGSGLIELDDGSRIRVSYAAKNGHPYTSIGQGLDCRRCLIRAGNVVAHPCCLVESG